MSALMRLRATPGTRSGPGPADGPHTHAQPTRGRGRTMTDRDHRHPAVGELPRRPRMITRLAPPTPTGHGQLLAHLVGDYLLQTQWMAARKTTATWPAVAHGAAYALPFLALTRSPWRLAVIAGSHAAIDRWRLARHLVWAKNQAAPAAWRPGHTATGYPDDMPVWLSTWLLIVADNTAHALVNAVVLRGGAR